MSDVIIAHSDSDVLNRLSRKIGLLKNVNVVDKVRVASNFFEAVRKSNPDVLIMGMKFENISGLDLVDKLIKTDPVPILVVSSGEKLEREEAVRSLSYGVIDVLEADYSPEEIRSLIGVALKAEKSDLRPEDLSFPKVNLSSEKIIVIGSSTGGPGTLEFILKNIPETISVPILVAQHMSATYTSLFAQRLDSLCSLKVKEAQQGEEIDRATVYLAPGDKDMRVDSSEKISLIDGSNRPTPSIDELFKSVSSVYGSRTVALVLTGMGKDAGIGSRFIKSEKGQVIVQDRDTSKIYGMGKHVVNQGDADRVLPLEEIPQALIRCLK